VKEAHADLEVILGRIVNVFLALANDFTIRDKIETIPPLPYVPEPSMLAAFLLKFESLVCKRLAPAFTNQDKLLALISKLHHMTFAEIRSKKLREAKQRTTHA